MLASNLRDLARWFLDRKIVQISEKQENDFNLRNIGRDPVYFDLRLVEDSRFGNGITPQMIKSIVCHHEEIVRRNIPFLGFDCVVGVPRGGDPFAEALGDMLEKIVVRMGKREDGTIKDFTTNAPPAESTILLVENVTTSGASIIKATHFLKEKGYRVTDVVSVIDRESGAKETLEMRGIRLLSLFTMSDILNFYMDRREVLPEPCQRSLEHAEELRMSRTSSGLSH